MKLIFFKRRYFLWLCVIGAVVFISILLIDNSLNKITNNYDQGEGDDVAGNGLASKYLEEIRRLKNKIDLLEEKSIVNEKSLASLKDFYSKIQKLNADKLPNLPPNLDLSNNNDFMNQHLLNRNDIIDDLNRDGINGLPNIIEQLKNKNQDILNGNKYELTSSSKEKIYSKQCEFLNEKKADASEIDIYNLFQKLPFDDPDGGVWKQGFDIKYDASQWSPQEKLQVIIIPHSHNDPGWILTLEEYFQQRTRNILDTVVNALTEKQTRKFIWAEISYLSMWWSQASKEMREKMRTLIIKTKQLEIVTGGWVMTDEANSNFYSMIEQMVLGHEWLKSNIDPSIQPSYGWSIDPFGYTPTMAYLLKQMGFKAMLIQRVHYHLKKYLAQNLQFEFNWRQAWSTENSKDTSMFCHVMPFYSYDIPHTCGPDPKICCQFDFKRLEGRLGCPWGIPAQAINQANINERANLLLDQYRKKAQLYGDKNSHNIVLVPLGDDFRYTDMQEARDQYENYEKLIEHINSNEHFNANIRFGTLQDYFTTLAEMNSKSNKKIETLQGDFFTYADRQDHYWSGYFTSRPFQKRLERLVESYLRTSEILYSITNLILNKNFLQRNDLFKLLSQARQNLALFQHHDGITGTSKTHVVRDYSSKLYKSLSNCRDIIEMTSSYLTSNSQQIQKIYSLDDVSILNDFEASNARPLLTFDENDASNEKKIVLFNPNTVKSRHEIISVRVNWAYVDVRDESDKSLLKNVQVSLIWPNNEGGPLFINNDPKRELNENLAHGLQFDQDYFEVLFEVNLKPLSFSTFTILKKEYSDVLNRKMDKVDFYQNEFKQERVDSIKNEIKLK